MDSPGPALPLAEAARRLGITAETLRKRRQRGKVPGAYQDDTGQWYVPVAYVDNPSVATVRTDKASTALTRDEVDRLIVALSEVAREVRELRQVLAADPPAATRPALTPGHDAAAAAAAPAAPPAPDRRAVATSGQDKRSWWRRLVDWGFIP